MKNNLTCGKIRIPYDDLFNEHLSDIVIEMERLKLKMLRKNMDGIKDHLARIDNFILSIMDAQLVLAEKSKNYSN